MPLRPRQGIVACQRTLSYRLSTVGADVPVRPRGGRVCGGDHIEGADVHHSAYQVPNCPFALVLSSYLHLLAHLLTFWAVSEATGESPTARLLVFILSTLVCFGWTLRAHSASRLIVNLWFSDPLLRQPLLGGPRMTRDRILDSHLSQSVEPPPVSA